MTLWTWKQSLIAVFLVAIIISACFLGSQIPMSQSQGQNGSQNQDESQSQNLKPKIGVQEAFVDEEIMHVVVVSGKVDDATLASRLSSRFIVISITQKPVGNNSDFWFTPGPAVHDVATAIRFAHHMVPFDVKNAIIWTDGPPVSDDDIRSAEQQLLSSRAPSQQQQLRPGVLGVRK